MIEFLLGINLLVWPIAIMEFCLILGLVVWEANPVLPIMSLVAVTALCDYVFGIGLAAAIAANPALITIIIIVYTILGILWTMFRWWLFNENTKEEYTADFEIFEDKERVSRAKRLPWKNEALQLVAEEDQPSKALIISDFLFRKGIKTYGESAEYIESDDFFTPYEEVARERVIEIWRDTHTYITRWRGKLPPKPSDNKARIVNWMMYWPFSVIWTVFDDLLRKIGTMIFRKIIHVYEKITERVFTGVDF